MQILPFSGANLVIFFELSKKNLIFALTNLKNMMTQRPLRLAIFGNCHQAEKSASIREVLACLRRKGDDILMEREFYDFLTLGQHIPVDATTVFDGDRFDADFVISMGGDGTFLRSAHFVGSKNIPVMGVNTGRLGFLADVRPVEIETAIDALHAGEFELEAHAVIEVLTDGAALKTCPRALNDIAVLKRDNASMISIRTTVNGHYLNTYQADGLIVSTPTGSTAYSLSNGGPIIVPQTGTLCLTAVAPHSLNVRPIVVKDDSQIEITVESRSHNFLIAVDGRSEKCDENTRLTIRRAPHSIMIVRRSGQGYFSTLRQKMSWGMDTRGA